MESMHVYSDEQRTKFEREFHERMKENKYTIVLDVLDNDKGVKKGDMVIVLNGYDCPIGPYKVLGFEDGAQSVYLDWDCFWVACPISKIVEINGIDCITNK